MHLIGLPGMVVLIGLAWAMSYHRTLFPVRTVAWGLGLQFLFALATTRALPGVDVDLAAVNHDLFPLRPLG